MITINTIVLSLASIALFYVGYTALTFQRPIIPEKPIFLWSESTGKERSIQSKTGDASMQTELRRRQAIQSIGREYPSRIKESRTSSGSSNGTTEAFMISAICPCIPQICNYIFDGGIYSSEFCNILDGSGSRVYDGGYSSSEVCQSCPPDGPKIYDGGFAKDEYCKILSDNEKDGAYYDGGVYDTIVCGS